MHIERFHDALIFIVSHGGLAGARKHMKDHQMSFALVSFDKPVLPSHLPHADRYRKAGVTLEQVCKAIRKGKKEIVLSNGKVYFR